MGFVDNKKNRLCSWGIPILLGLGAALFMGGLKARRAFQSSSVQVKNLSSQVSQAKEGSRLVDPRSNPANLAALPPPRMAMDPVRQRETAEQRTKHEVAQLTEAAKLTPKQQGLAAALIENIQRSRIIMEALGNPDERAARLAQLERLERKSLDSVIDVQQAAAVDAYFATRIPDRQ